MLKYMKQSYINLLPHRDAFKYFCNQSRHRSAALARAVGSGFTLFANRNMVRYDPTIVDLISNLFGLSLYNDVQT